VPQSGHMVHSNQAAVHAGQDGLPKKRPHNPCEPCKPCTTCKPCNATPCAYLNWAICLLAHNVGVRCQLDADAAAAVSPGGLGGDGDGEPLPFALNREHQLPPGVVPAGRVEAEVGSCKTRLPPLGVCAGSWSTPRHSRTARSPACSHHSLQPRQWSTATHASVRR